MRLGTLVVAAALIVGMLSLAPTAAADDLVSETVETPVTTFYVFVRHGDVDEPNPHLTQLCHHPGITPEVCVPYPSSGTSIPPFSYVHVQVYQETNGCDGLQRDAGDCDGDGEQEPADQTTFKYHSGG